MISKTCRASQQCKKVIKQFLNDRNTNNQCYICLGAHQTFIFTEGGGKQLFYYRETITNSVTQSHFHCSNKSNMSFCNLACFECEAALTIITQTPRKSDALVNALSCSSLIMFTQQQSTVSQPWSVPSLHSMLRSIHCLNTRTSRSTYCTDGNQILHGESYKNKNHIVCNIATRFSKLTMKGCQCWSTV